MNDTDLSRIKGFRQLKGEIRGSDRHLIVGIDIAKSKHHAFLGTANGKTVLKGLIFEKSSSGTCFHAFVLLHYTLFISNVWLKRKPILSHFKVTICDLKFNSPPALLEALRTQREFLFFWISLTPVESCLIPQGRDTENEKPLDSADG